MKKLTLAIPGALLTVTASMLAIHGQVSAQGSVPPTQQPDLSSPVGNQPSGLSTVLPPAPGSSGVGVAPSPLPTTVPGSVGRATTLAAEYSRQVFLYPRDDRPDPVSPPASLGATSGEENLTVAGIIMDTRNPRLSKAMIRAKGFEKTRYAVSAGDKIEQYRVVEIKPTSVVMAVPVLGGTRTVVLERARDKVLQGGGEMTSGGQRRQTVVTELDPGTAQGAGRASVKDDTSAVTPAITGPTPIIKRQ